MPGPHSPCIPATPRSYEKAKLRGQYTDEQRKRENAKAALDRYVHYFERFTFHDKGIRKARADSAAVEQDKEKIANVTGTPPGQLRFLTDAWETVAQVRGRGWMRGCMGDGGEGEGQRMDAWVHGRRWRR